MVDDRRLVHRRRRVHRPGLGPHRGPGRDGPLLRLVDRRPRRLGVPRAVDDGRRRPDGVVLVQPGARAPATTARRYQAPAFSILHYAGDGKFDYELDLMNIVEVTEVLGRRRLVARRGLPVPRAEPRPRPHPASPRHPLTDALRRARRVSDRPCCKARRARSVARTVMCRAGGAAPIWRTTHGGRGDRCPVVGHGPRDRRADGARVAGHVVRDAAERRSGRRCGDEAERLLRLLAVLRGMHRRC